MRFTRDRRGYENTFVVQGGGRSSDRGRPAILYWFRTPPDIRVGRTALDEEAIRALEAEHPDVRFDWPRLLSASAESASRGGEPARQDQPPRSPENRRQPRSRRRSLDRPPTPERRAAGRQVQAGELPAADSPGQEEASPEAESPPQTSD